MSPVVERNDVDISRLFAWSKEVIITGRKEKEIKVYLRLLGDADMNRTKIMALRKSAELRRALKDPDSNERLAFIPYKEELTKETMTESILLFSIGEFTQQAIREAIPATPKEPSSDASTEKLERFQKEVDEYPKKRENALREFVEKLTDKKREEFLQKTEEELYTTYQGILIKELCEQELLKKFREYCLFFGIYSDKKMAIKFFDSIESVENLPTEVKEKLISEFTLLEIESEELKK
jgi:hypothetical protein